MRDKFRLLVRIPRVGVKKNVWDIKDDQDWYSFKANVASCLPQGDLSSMTVDQLASSLASSLREGGISSIGYKRQTVNKSMRSKTLPRNVVDEISLKLIMERNWKSLPSSLESSMEAVLEAETDYL